jgi:nucleotide-binding universal stress UspA family protein
MSYRDILVFLDGSLDNEARVDFAVELATVHGARLTGVDVNAEAAFAGEWSQRARSLEERFRARSRSEMDVRYRVAGREATGWKNQYAHYADLLIATQPNSEASSMIVPAVPEDVLVSAGVPMVVLPHGWRQTSRIRKVVIAWSPSGQATRAVHDAVPILARAETVTVFAFDPPSDTKDRDIDLLRDHLSAHGIRVEIDRWPNTGDLTPLEALFASRAVEDADIIVAGAYSHSRFRETLFGGVTKGLLQQFSIPVLVSH